MGIGSIRWVLICTLFALLLLSESEARKPRNKKAKKKKSETPATPTDSGTDKQLDEVAQAIKLLDTKFDALLTALNGIEEGIDVPLPTTKTIPSSGKSNEKEKACKDDYKYPADCTDVQLSGQLALGLHTIKPHNMETPFTVYCELLHGEAWTVIQRRVDNSTLFNRTWDDYKKGFGDVSKNFWLGNDRIHKLTYQRHYKMRLDYKRRSNGVYYYGVYPHFAVGSEEDLYQLLLNGDWMGTATDYIGKYNQALFSTYDRDNDGNGYQCTQKYGGSGGFWYKSDCSSYRYTNINGRFSCDTTGCAGWGSSIYIQDISLKIARIE